MAPFLFPLLLSASKIMASGAITGFAESAGARAYEAIKARLTERHGAKSMPMVDEADTNPVYAEAVKADLAKPGVQDDAELLALAETLRAAIEALPPETQALYAVDIKTIRSDKTLTFNDVEGVRADEATSKGDMSFTNVKAPRGN